MSCIILQGNDYTSSFKDHKLTKLGTNKSRLALLFYSYEMTKQIYDCESELNHIVKAPATKDPSTKTHDRKRKAQDMKEMDVNKLVLFNLMILNSRRIMLLT